MLNTRFLIAEWHLLGASKNTSHANIVQLLFWHHWGNVGNMKTPFQKSPAKQLKAAHREDSACPLPVPARFVLSCPLPVPARFVLSHVHSRDQKNDCVLYKSNRTLLTDDFAVKFNLNPLYRINSKGNTQKQAYQRYSTEQGTQGDLENDQDWVFTVTRQTRCCTLIIETINLRWAERSMPNASTGMAEAEGLQVWDQSALYCKALL